jgi:hypothetical protein
MNNKSCFNCKYFHKYEEDFTLTCRHVKSSIYRRRDILPDPKCPYCNGNGYIDVDTGIAMKFAIGTFPVEACVCCDDSDDENLATFFARDCEGFEEID